MGGLCASAPRPERPAGGRFRDAVHFRPGADRIGKTRQELPVGNQSSRLRHRRVRRTRRRMTWKSAASAGVKHWTGCAMWWGGWSPLGGRPAPRKALRSCGGGFSSPWPTRPVQKSRRCRAGFRGSLPDAAGGVPARVPGRRLREAYQGGVPDPPGNLRPALHRLVHAGEIPAHPRRFAADGCGDSQSMGKRRQEPADSARQIFPSMTRVCSLS